MNSTSIPITRGVNGRRVNVHAPPTFSVVIPLEFHRDQFERCLTAWTREQTCSRDAYELVVVAPEDSYAALLTNVQSLLREQDTLVRDSSCHDMGLCVAGAKAARGKVLFFTESHCWPEPDVLERASRVLREHPEWAGFSARSIRVTHNRLSEVEADMYEADIEYGMLHHPWRKILDQCLVVRRDAYEKSGGFEAELGHFAEWVLAARFFCAGLKVGYAPQVRVHHFYIGDFKELEEFTNDFTTGHARFFARRPADPCAPMFPEAPYSSQAGDYRRDAALLMIRLVLRARVPLLSRLLELCKWFTVAVFGSATARCIARWDAWFARHWLNWTLAFTGRKKRQAAMRKYCAALVGCCGAELLASSHEKLPGASLGELQFGGPLLLPAAGLHLREEWQGRACRWSAPEAMIELPLEAGPHRITLSWLPVRLVSDADPAFFWNGARIPAADVDMGPNSATIRVNVCRGKVSWLGWVCRRFHAPGDRRRLGLLMDRVEWNSVAEGGNGFGS